MKDLLDKQKSSNNSGIPSQLDPEVKELVDLIFDTKMMNDTLLRMKVSIIFIYMLYLEQDIFLLFNRGVCRILILFFLCYIILHLRLM